MDDTDTLLMDRALALAERGRGAVEPNPLVGAVVVRDGQIVGEGWHQKYGEAHAEVHALAAAGGAARGATLYVTLEPCCHFGKTPPCTDAVLRAGIRRVVAAMSDPFPQVAGRGLALLRDAGLEVTVGVGAEAARLLNQPFLKRVRTGRPYVIAKWAMTLDGKIATRTGDARWVSGEASRRRAHELRGRLDAILVGVGTVLADDPLLTARPPGPRTPTRIVLDSRLRTPLESQLVRTARDVPLLLVHGPGVPADHRRRYEEADAACLELAGPGGRPDVAALLDHLGSQKASNLLVEGGAAVLGSFLDAGALDAVQVYVAPKLAGGGGPGPVAGAGVDLMAQAAAVTGLRLEALGEDVVLDGRLREWA
jgi:diaminohydroxyphosphoribosylaminopyrimidine deaminase/5-amino-6-(5-phosphoribosylamino)uracil reductase